MVHSSEPPNVGRVAASDPSVSTSRAVQSAVSPVSSVVATEPARSRPSVVAPSNSISGLWVLTTSVGALTKSLASGVAGCLAFRPDHDGGELDLELVGELTSRTHQLPRNRVDL